MTNDVSPPSVMANTTSFGAHAKIAKLFAPERGEILKAFDGFDERIIAAGHHAERAVFEILH